MIIENIVATVGTYKTKDGTEKKQYLTIGKLMTKDDWSKSIKIDCVPTWDWNWWAGVYSQEKKKEEQVIVWTWVQDFPFR